MRGPPRSSPPLLAHPRRPTKSSSPSRITWSGRPPSAPLRYMHPAIASVKQVGHHASSVAAAPALRAAGSRRGCTNTSYLNVPCDQIEEFDRRTSIDNLVPASPRSESGTNRGGGGVLISDRADQFSARG